MDFALYSRLIGEASQEGAMSVKLNFLGEPLLNRRLPEMVSVAREHKLWVMINTNAVLLDPKMSRSLLEAGLTDIFFSFDSPYLEEYERIRVGAKYQKTLANIASFMAIKEELGLNYVQTRASMVLPEDPYRRKDIQRDYIKLFRDLKVAEIGFGLPTVMERDYSSLNPKGFFRCPDLFRRIFIFQDGVAGPCCGDWERRLVVGDANTESLKEIWNNDSYRALRAAHLTGEYQSVPACKVCSVPYLSQISL
jgi:MoaA/NifB/PqqE/SkfB family radical SAM enzyme